MSGNRLGTHSKIEDIVAAGYRRVSNKGGNVSRIDRPD